MTRAPGAALAQSAWRMHRLLATRGALGAGVADKRLGNSIRCRSFEFKDDRGAFFDVQIWSHSDQHSCRAFRYSRFPRSGTKWCTASHVPIYKECRPHPAATREEVNGQTLRTLDVQQELRALLCCSMTRRTLVQRGVEGRFRRFSRRVAARYTVGARRMRLPHREPTE